MADWYDEGVVALKEEISLGTGVALEDVKAVYAYLVDEGFIDYDFEKEYLWDKFGDEDEEEVDILYDEDEDS